MCPAVSRPLRVRLVQDRIGRAERAAAAGRWDEARTAYRAAIEASPDVGVSASRSRGVERKAGRAEEALVAARAAIALDPDDAAAHLMVGDILAERDDFDGALAAYGRAAALDPSPSLEAAMARVRERARDAALPAEYRGIVARPQATRADIAALFGVRLGPVLSQSPQRQVVVTDVRGHWARPWIQAVTRAGAMEVFPNYTFQPGAPLRRVGSGRCRQPRAGAHRRRRRLRGGAVGPGRREGLRRAARPTWRIPPCGVPSRPA